MTARNMPIAYILAGGPKGNEYGGAKRAVIVGFRRHWGWPMTIFVNIYQGDESLYVFEYQRLFRTLSTQVKDDFESEAPWRLSEDGESVYYGESGLKKAKADGTLDKVKFGDELLSRDELRKLWLALKDTDFDDEPLPGEGKPWEAWDLRMNGNWSVRAYIPNDRTRGFPGSSVPDAHAATQGVVDAASRLIEAVDDRMQDPSSGRLAQVVGDLVEKTAGVCSLFHLTGTDILPPYHDNENIFGELQVVWPQDSWEDTYRLCRTEFEKNGWEIG